MNASENVTDHITAGRAVYARNLGVPEDEAERMLAARAGTQYAQEAFLAAGGPGWSGTELTDRDRSVAIIAALVGQHIVDARLITYLNAARAADVTEEGLAELMPPADRLPRSAGGIGRHGRGPEPGATTRRNHHRLMN